MRCELKHRGIDVRGDDLRPRSRPMHGPRDNTGAGSSLENAVWLDDRAALGDELRIRFEQKRAHVAVVKRGS